MTTVIHVLLLAVLFFLIGVTLGSLSEHWRPPIGLNALWAAPFTLFVMLPAIAGGITFWIKTQ